MKLSGILLAVSALAVSLTCRGATTLLPVESGNLPVSAPGDVKRYTARCASLGSDFTVDVWFPEGYDRAGERRYPVVYMQDGQNLFDPKFAFGGTAWEIDKALGKLIDAGMIETPIIVGIHNRGTCRPADYIPEKPLKEYLTAGQLAESGIGEVTGNRYYGDEYAAFVARELKPAVDIMFPTRPEREHTFIMGSSMGALASLYAMCEYPDVYGGVGCLSTHWIGNFDYSSVLFPTAMLEYLRDNLPTPGSHRLYLDRGTEGLDAAYGAWDDKAVALAEEKGYSTAGGTLYIYVDEGATHNERDWCARVDRALDFFLHNASDPYILPETVPETYSVIFQDSRYSRAKPCAFAWGVGVVILGQWPGTSMTATEYGGAPAWRISWESKYEPTNIIFNNGDTARMVQTADLEFHNGYVYDFDGPVEPVASADFPESSDGLTVSVYPGQMEILSGTARTVCLAGVGGLSRTLRLAAGKPLAISLPAGLYIVASRKVLVR